MSMAPVTLFKRSNGIWYLLVYEGDRPRWKSTGERSKVLALKRLTEFSQARMAKPAPASPCLSVFTKDFLTHAASVYAKPTCDIFRIGLGHLRTVAGGCMLSELSPRDIDRYKARRLQEVSPASVNVEVSGLGAVCPRGDALGRFSTRIRCFRWT